MLPTETSREGSGNAYDFLTANTHGNLAHRSVAKTPQAHPTPPKIA